MHLGIRKLVGFGRSPRIQCVWLRNAIVDESSQSGKSVNNHGEYHMKRGKRYCRNQCSRDARIFLDKSVKSGSKKKRENCRPPRTR